MNVLQIKILLHVWFTFTTISNNNVGSYKLSISYTSVIILNNLHELFYFIFIITLEEHIITTFILTIKKLRLREAIQFNRN